MQESQQMSELPQEKTSPPKRPRFSRGDYRARSHESAHENSDGPMKKPDVGGRDDVPAGEAQLVQDSEALAELIEHLRSEGCFAYDSEFIGELTYIPKLCLIQVSTTKRIALIDPLAEL